jgi:ribosomal protein S18 acetylase RimI-like enzyme
MISKIEEMSMNAFPALSTVLLNGWVLRFANGYAKRANSVNPIYRCSNDLVDNIELCENMYKSKQLDTVFKLTENDDSYKIDEILKKRGYSYEAKTNIMLKDIRNLEATNMESMNVVIYREINEKWFEAFTRMNKINPQNTHTLRLMLDRIIPEVYCAGIIEEDKIIAVGLGVAQGEYIGMYDICVQEDKRRGGLGTKIMISLINEALKNGYKYSYLQVVDANEAAKLLYKGLGYQKQYSYWYRVKTL